MKVSTYQKLIHGPLQAYLKDPIPNVRFSTLQCLEHLASVMNEKSMEDIARKAGAQLADDSDAEVKRLAKLLQSK